MKLFVLKITVKLNFFLDLKLPPLTAFIGSPLS